MLAENAVESQDADLSLLRQYVASGDPEIFAEIVRRYSGVVYSASCRILNDDGRAQEVSQETFFRLMRQPRLVNQSLGGWLHRTATHLAIDTQRSEACRRRREKKYSSASAFDRSCPDLSWEEVSPQVDAALEELPESMRLLLTRHFLQGTPQAELAQEMNLSAATISRKIKTAVDELRKILRNKGIYVGLFALLEFCRTQTAKAVPPKLVTELAKMGMVGPIDIAPPPPHGPPAAIHRLYQLRPGKMPSKYSFLGTCVGVIGLLAWLTICSFFWIDHSAPASARVQHIEEKNPPPTAQVSHRLR